MVPLGSWHKVMLLGESHSFQMHVFTFFYRSFLFFEIQKLSPKWKVSASTGKNEEAHSQITTHAYLINLEGTIVLYRKKKERKKKGKKILYKAGLRN